MGFRKGKRRPFQPWPFYRRTHFDAEMQAQVEDMWKKMDEGYDPREDPESPLYRGKIYSINSKLARPNYGKRNYKLDEKPKYLRGRKKMAANGYDIGELDFIIAKLLHGERLTKGNHPHKLRGDKKGLMECHIGGRDSDWVLIYQYEHDKLILHALDTGTHEDRGVD